MIWLNCFSQKKKERLNCHSLHYTLIFKPIFTHSFLPTCCYPGHINLHIPFFREGLGEAYDGDIAFASSLETFGGGHNDPISVAFGG